MQTLSDPQTDLPNFFKNIGRASAEVAPVARVQAAIFAKMAKTFDAFSACAGCLQQTVAKSPPALQSGIDSFRVQEPFLLEFTKLSRKLRPVAQTLHGRLGTINATLETGIPVLKRTVSLNRQTGETLKALDDLAQQPQTLLALKHLHTTFLVGRPLLDYVAPYQTVCNNAVAFLTGLGGDHSIGVTNGTAQNALVKLGTNDQSGALSQDGSGRPADIPANKDPQTYMDPAGDHYQQLHWQQYGPAVDAQGNADCQAGQTGYINGPLDTSGRKYAPADIAPGQTFKDWEAKSAGGSHTVFDQNTPGLAGGSYVARRLGIDNLRDVP